MHVCMLGWAGQEWKSLRELSLPLTTCRAILGSGVDTLRVGAGFCGARRRRVAKFGNPAPGGPTYPRSVAAQGENLSGATGSLSLWRPVVLLSTWNY